jgi:hypothetical protein
MATVLRGINVDKTTQYGVVYTNPGPAVVANDIELNVDLTKVTSKQQILLALEAFEDAINSNDGLPP